MHCTVLPCHGYVLPEDGEDLEAPEQSSWACPALPVAQLDKCSMLRHKWKCSSTLLKPELLFGGQQESAANARLSSAARSEIPEGLLHTDFMILHVEDLHRSTSLRAGSPVISSLLQHKVCHRREQGCRGRRRRGPDSTHVNGDETLRQRSAAIPTVGVGAWWTRWVR